MKQFVILGIGASMFFMSSCVESSQKYKDLLARADSLNAVSVMQTQELEGMFADINDITAGMQSLRDAENLLTLEAEKENKAGSISILQLIQLINDVCAFTEAIAVYKSQIATLESKNKSQSAEFKRLIANLNAELDARSAKIVEITNQLAATNKELAFKVEEVKTLTQNVDSLDKETKRQKMMIAEPIVSSQAQKADFINIDIRETTAIPVNSKKAKLLSVHPADSYTLEAGEDGNLVLKITDVTTFWRQTNY